MFCARKPGWERPSKPLSSVRRTASKTMAVAATMQSGSFSLVVRRSAMVFCLISPVISIITVLSERKLWRRSSSSGGNEGLENSSISLITLINRSASLSSFSKSVGIALPLSVMKITALVSSTKRCSIPFIADSPLVRHAVSVCFRRKYAEIMRNRFAIGVGSSFFCHLQGFFDCSGGSSALRPGSRRKGQNNRSRWNFRRNSNPAVSRYVYGLRNGHMGKCSTKAP